MSHLRQSVIKRPRYWFSNPRNENSFLATCANFIGGMWSVAAVKWADAVIDARAHPPDRSGPQLSWLEHAAQSGGFGGSNPVGPTAPLKRRGATTRRCSALPGAREGAARPGPR